MGNGFVSWNHDCSLEWPAWIDGERRHGHVTL